MNVYDSHRMADTLAPEGYVETAHARGRRPRHPQHLPHPREGGREGLFRARPHARAQAGGGAARAATSRSRSPAASRRPKARKSSAARRRSISWSARRAITACPICSRAPRAASKVVDTEFPVEDKFDVSRRRAARRCARAASRPSSPCRKAATSSAPSASCPIRAARKSRARSRKIVAEVERLADAGVREITLIGQNVNAYHGEGPDGRAGRSARLLHRARRHPGHRAAALHHQPSARHGRTT